MNLDLKVVVDLMEDPANLDQEEKEDLLVKLVHLVALVHQALQVKVDLLESQVKEGYRVFRALLAHVVMMAALELLVNLA